MDQERFIEFEKEFRKGYKLEKSGQPQEALKWYQRLEKDYAGLPQAGKLATLQIRNLSKLLETHPGMVKDPSATPRAKSPRRE
jgi:hypothetical protein